MNVQKAVWHQDHVGIGALRLSSEDTSKIGSALDRRDDRLNIEGNSRGLERIEIVVGKRRRSRIEQKSGSLCLRGGLFEQFQPFAAGGWLHNSEAGRIALGPRKTFDETTPDRI